MRVIGMSLAASLLAAPAWAVPVTYDLTGTVTQIGTNPDVSVSVGQVIPILIQVETAYPASPPGSGHYASTGAFDPTTGLSEVILSATFNGRADNGLIQTVDVGPSAIDFSTASPQVNAGFTLDLSGALPGALPNNNLPATLDPALFTSGTFTVTQAFSPSQDGFSGTIDGLAGTTGTAVPEPASIAMVGIGLLGLLGASNRRRRPR